MQETDKQTIEKWINNADRAHALFPEFCLVRNEGEPVCLWFGRSSSVYLMTSRQRPDHFYAMKVTGYTPESGTSESFWTTSRIQRMLCEDSNCVVRTIDAIELVIDLDGKTIAPHFDTCFEKWEEDESKLHLRCLLMERLFPIIEKDRFGKAVLSVGLLQTENEIINMSLEIGLALIDAHSQGVLHRDIKLENILYDRGTGIYKLSDFGMAKYTGGDNAETVIYTDGYGAPEIERQISDSYNETADIYSFGITLYLLFNDLKFPGSEGYYPRAELQYSPDYVFPAPVHASEELSRIIRKMCSFHPEDRYPYIGDALTDIIAYAEGNSVQGSGSIYEAIEAETETFHEDNDREAKESERRDKRENISNRMGIRTHLDSDMDYNLRLDSFFSKRFLIIIGILLIPLFGLHGEGNEVTLRPLYWVLPAGLLAEALFQKIRELHILFAIVFEIFLIWFAYQHSPTIPIIVSMLVVLFGIPEMTFTSGLSLSIWMTLCVFGKTVLPKLMMYGPVRIILVIFTIAVAALYLLIKFVLMLDRKFITEK